MNYCNEKYGVKNDHGRVVTYKDRVGIILKSTHHQHYVHVNFNDRTPGKIEYIHPTDPNLIYTEEFDQPRRLTKSKQRYQDYLNSTWYDAGESFAKYLGIKE